MVNDGLRILISHFSHEETNTLQDLSTDYALAEITKFLTGKTAPELFDYRIQVMCWHQKY